MFFITAHDDYLASTSLSLSFAPCDMRACVSLPLKDNDIAERVRSFAIFLDRRFELDKRITLDSFIGELIIFDDDGNNSLHLAVLSFREFMYYVL